MVPPLRLILYTSGEEAEFQRYDKHGKLFYYIYVRSNTKLGMITCYTEEWLQRLLNIQDIFKPVEPFDTNFEL